MLKDVEKPVNNNFSLAKKQKIKKTSFALKVLNK